MLILWPISRELRIGKECVNDDTQSLAGWRLKSKTIRRLSWIRLVKEPTASILKRRADEFDERTFPASAD